MLRRTAGAPGGCTISNRCSSAPAAWRLHAAPRSGSAITPRSAAHAAKPHRAGRRAQRGAAGYRQPQEAGQSRGEGGRLLRRHRTGAEKVEPAKPKTSAA